MQSTSTNAEMSTDRDVFSSNSVPRQHIQYSHEGNQSQGVFLPNEPQDNQQAARPKIRVEITPKWDDMTDLTKYTAARHQTLFAMDTSGRTIIGTPPKPEEIQRVCASITSYMKPRFTIQLLDQNGQPLRLSLQTKTTIVNATTGESDEGTCDHCKLISPSKRPIVYQWRSGRNKLFSEIFGQTDEQGRQILDIKIGCLTGTGLSRQQKGHKHDFMIRTEVMQCSGVLGYSVPIQMGSKYIDCSQKHTKKKFQKEGQTPRPKKSTPKQQTKGAEMKSNSLPMQFSPTSTSLFPHFGETVQSPPPLQRHGIVLPPIATFAEVKKSSSFSIEEKILPLGKSTPGRETSPWKQDFQNRDSNQIDRVGSVILPPIKMLPQFENESNHILYRQALPPVPKSSEGSIIPPLEVILSTISQEHGNNWKQNSPQRGPMLELAENFMEAAISMEQASNEGNYSQSPLVERHHKKQRRKELFLSEGHLFRDPFPPEAMPISPMSDTSPNFGRQPIFSQNIENTLGCHTNAITMEQRAEIQNFLNGNRKNHTPGSKSLHFIVLNNEPIIWNAQSNMPITVEQTIVRLNYDTGAWNLYKKQISLR